MKALTEDAFRWLRTLSMSDARCIDELLSIRPDDEKASGLDPKTFALVRLGALLALDAVSASFQSGVEAALAAGATTDEVAGTLVAAAPVVGIVRIVAAAPQIAIALGHDVDAAFEDLDA